MNPFYVDEAVTLYHGDCREIVPALNLTVDAIVADPPYGETSLAWDRWPDDWPTAISGAAKSMWCFGSMRMFLDRRDQFVFWKLSQDVVWEKPNGTGVAVDRFRRVHEIATFWYRGPWDEAFHQTPRDGGAVGTSRAWLRRPSAERAGVRTVERTSVVYVDDGSRLARSVLWVDNMHGRADHPTEKPVGILDPLIRYACPPGGTVLDPFAGSGSTAEAARLTGRKAILVEADERYCELIARRMSQGVLTEEPA
jgi:site-specific DNA-methyltransferase (adenine-specific)